MPSKQGNVEAKLAQVAACRQQPSWSSLHPFCSFQDPVCCTHSQLKQALHPLPASVQSGAAGPRCHLKESASVNSSPARGHCQSFQVERSCRRETPSSSTSSMVGSGASGAPGMGSAPAAISAANSASSMAAAHPDWSMWEGDTGCQPADVTGACARAGGSAMKAPRCTAPECA